MRSIYAITLIMWLLSPAKKSYSQENNEYIIYFTKYYSAENYSKAAEIGARILTSEELRPDNDERFRLLYKTIRSYIYAKERDKAYSFVSNIPLSQNDSLFNSYLALYQGIISVATNRNEQAKELLTQLLQLNNQQFLVDSIKAKIYHNLSIVYGQEERHELKLDYLNKSFEFEKRTLLNSANYENYNLSVEVYTSSLYNNYKQYERAYRVFQEALELPFNKEINSYNHALYQNYVELLLIMGMEERALSITQKLSKFYNNKPQYYIDEYANLLNTLSENYKEQNNYTNTILYATKALAITPIGQNTKHIRSSSIQSLSETYFNLQQYDKMKFYLYQNIAECKQTDYKLLASAYLSAGQFLARIFEDEKAYAFIDSAKHVYYNYLQLPHNRRFENRIALAYYELEQYNQCLYHLERVGEILMNNSNYTHYLFWDNNYEKALCHNKLHEYSKAYMLLKESLKEMILKYPHLQDRASSIQNSHYAILYRKVNIALANNLYSQYEMSGNLKTLQEAMASIEVAGNGLDLLRSKQNYDRDRLITGEMYYDFILQSTKVAMALYKATSDEQYLNQAFTFIQKGKSYALIQGVADKKYKLNSGVPIETINALNYNKKQYDRYMQRYNEALFSYKSDSSLTNQLSEKMSLCMSNIDSINSFIKKNFPQYKEEEARVPALTLAETRERINSNQSVIDYYQAEDEIFRFVIDKDSYQCDIIKVDVRFDDALQFVLDELSTPFVGQHSPEHIQQFASASYIIYKSLLKDIEEEIEDRELIIIPHSDLAYLPFESLLTKDVSKQKPRFKEYPWLIKTQTISYAYNTALLNYQSSVPVQFNRVIAFAPEYCGQTVPDSVDLNSSVFIDSILPPLEGAQKEILSIDQVFTTKLYKGKKANKANFIGSMQDNDIIHLAMHSLNDDIQPFNSQIVFASEDTISGSFTAAEIYNYSIKSPLTVLSSCSSGSGQKRKGEGLLSIARAFTFAGVESQVMTLWPVNDVNGANITTGFYKELRKGINKNKALRISKLNYLSTADGVHSHPYYWANYVLSGNTNPIKQKMPKGIFKYLLAFAMLSVIVLFIYDKRQSR